MKSIFLAFLLFGCILVFPKDIVTTLNPYYLITKELVQDKLNVILLIKSAVDPHDYSPTVNDVKILSNASLILANGLELDNRYLKNHKRVIYLGEQIPVTELFEGKASEGKYNPHVWLSLDFLIKYIVPTITESVSKVDSSNKEFYENNARKLISSLREVSRKFDSLLKGCDGTVVVVDHPTFAYLFKRYGIMTLSIEEGHGKQPSIKHIKDIIETAKKNRLLGVFVDPQFDTSTISMIIKELNIKPKRLDSLGFSTKVKSITEFFENIYLVLKEAIQRK
ncbi:MAG: metal ABC transporter substrate-binding protein [Fervidobacterium sp.]|nr:metal ABC transporter substrate-binding protein [Fervidobacterium sp.]